MNAAGSQQIDHLFADIRTYISDAREICERGEFMQLQGMDGRVSKICDSVAALEKEQAKTYADELSALMQELNELQAMFIERRDSLSGEINDTNQHHQAAKAYKNTEFSTPKPSDDD